MSLALRLLFFSLLLSSRPASAFLVTPGAVERALTSADAVAEVEVLSVENYEDERGWLYKRATAKVDRVLRSRGAAESLRGGDTMEIHMAGGELAEVGMYFSGLPRPHVGKRYRAHLRHESGNRWRAIGWDFGWVPLEPVRSFSRNRTDGSDGAGDGAFLYWDDTYLPIPYFIALEPFQGLSDFVAEIDASFAPWRDLPGIKLDFRPMGCSSMAANQNDGINNIILITEDWPFDSDAIAITRNFYIAGNSPKAGLILDSDILLNNVHHEFTVTGEPGKHDVRNIITHEVGHFIGLGHEVTPADEEATMYASAAAGELKKRTLESNDIDGLRDAYAGVVPKPASLAPGPSCRVSDGVPACLAVPGAPAPSPITVVALMLTFWLGIRLARRTAAP